MYYFTSDEHYGHNNIIKYCDRPFNNIQEMNKELIERSNSIVNENDILIHAGDFTLGNKEEAYGYISKLKGRHIFLRGSHDYWNKGLSYIWEGKIEGIYVVVCHYNMRTWPRSHYNSYQLYGHSHGRIEDNGKQWDIGVDNNNFYPISFESIKKIMILKPENFNHRK